LVVEINDEGLYGYGQLAGLLRARYCTDKIQGINKTDGLPFKVREILNGMKERLKQSPEPTLVTA
jgi:2-oxoglutarate ferredoxin oxidoreductase subunit alpha